MDTITTKNNKLIAEFMGLNYIHEIAFIWETLYEQGHRNKDKLNNPNSYKHYHNSWDELMPVVEKIGSLNEVCDFNINYCSVYQHEVEVSNLFKNTFEPYTVSGETKIEAVYNACLKFIEYYSHNK